MKNTCLKSLLAGVCIGIGGIVYLNTVSVNNIAAALLFSVGLISISIFGIPLYTGRIGFATRKTFPGLIPVVVCNILGAAATGYLAAFQYAFDMTAMIERKAAQNPVQTILLAAGCGMLMYIAVFCYKKTGKLLALALPVGTFILCGFEHCVANAFYFGCARVLPAMLPHLLLAVIGNTLGSLVTNYIVMLGEETA